jgi:acetyl esterase/lipase
MISVMPAASDAFHPDLRGVSRFLPRAGISPATLRTVRTLTALLARRPAKGVEVETVGSASVRLYRPPSAEPLPALLWIHGGGYVIGTAAQDDALCRHVADTIGVVVASVDYRLAPESPFPAPLEDCYEALTWLARRPDVESDRIAVGGASAGGGLAAGLALLAHERGEVQLAFQLLTYPMLDDRTATRTDVNERNLRLWNNKANRFGWRSYTGYPPGSAAVTGLAAPARYGDLSGLPPAWIGVGTLDLFHDEDVAYAERLTAAGVACELQVVEGAFHGFDLVRPKAGVSREFRAAQVAALASALQGHKAGSG